MGSHAASGLPLNDEPFRGDENGCQADVTFTASDLAGLRRLVTDCCVASGLAEPRRGDFVLAVHEVAANAVTHGGGSGQVMIRVTEDELQCVVIDSGRGFRPGDRTCCPPGPADAEGGRGIWLAALLTDDLTIESHGTGTTVSVSVKLR